MDLSPSTRAAMVDAIPKLRRFALALCRNTSRADDLVQETLLRACTNIAQFRPGTAMAPWLTTILRNQYYSEHRKLHREVSDPDGIYAGALVAAPEQIPHVEMAELNGALANLPAPLREAIVMVGVGYSYDEAARNCGCATGTVKSRVHRARARLASMLSLEVGESPARLSPPRGKRAASYAEDLSE